MKLTNEQIFICNLALMLGKSYTEILELPLEELNIWKEYDRTISPINPNLNYFFLHKFMYFFCMSNGYKESINSILPEFLQSKNDDNDDTNDETKAKEDIKKKLIMFAKIVNKRNNKRNKK